MSHRPSHAGHLMVGASLTGAVVAAWIALVARPVDAQMPPWTVSSPQTQALLAVERPSSWSYAPGGANPFIPWHGRLERLRNDQTRITTGTQPPQGSDDSDTHGQKPSRSPLRLPDLADGDIVARPIGLLVVDGRAQLLVRDARGTSKIGPDAPDAAWTVNRVERTTAAYRTAAGTLLTVPVATGTLSDGINRPR